MLAWINGLPDRGGLVDLPSATGNACKLSCGLLKRGSNRDEPCFKLTGNDVFPSRRDGFTALSRSVHVAANTIEGSSLLGVPVQASALGLTLLALLSVFGLVGFVICRVDGLALFAPRRTKRVAGSADAFCAAACRLADGRCPLTESSERAGNCPLWRFVDADLPTSVHGSPFEHLRAG